jgi:hypothetical protein
MAVDTTEKTYNTALQLSDLSAKLMVIVRQFDAVIVKAQGGGIEFPGVDFSDTDLKFCTGDDIASAAQAAVDLKEWLESSFRDDVFDKVSAT